MRNVFKHFSIILLLTASSISGVYAQTTKQVYTKASGLTLIGKVMPGKDTYRRLDTADYPAIPPFVKYLLTNSAGMAVCFKTNSNVISAKWCVSASKPTPNMSAIAAKGLDLYIKKDGKWQFAGIGSPKEQCNDEILVKNLESGEKECLLYLPLYDKIDNPEVGVEAGSSIAPIPNPFQKKILIYGSSILQGAAASRPGMAYPSRLERETGLYFVNFGLSGSAKMEPAVADVVAAVDADAYILDCVPNSSPQQITERTASLVNKIRSAHPKAPIIIVQTLVREHGYFDTVIGKHVKDQNDNIQTEFLKLQKQGVKDLYFISGKNLLGSDHEATVDGTHPNDIGFDRMIQVIKPGILKIFRKYGIVASK